MSFDIRDDYDHVDSDLEYVLENVLFDPAIEDADADYHVLKEEFNSRLLNKCECRFCDSCGYFENESQSRPFYTDSVEKIEEAICTQKPLSHSKRSKRIRIEGIDESFDDSEAIGIEQDFCGYCVHGQNYKLDEMYNELVLSDLKKSGVIYECSESCSCSSQCRNRLVQFGPRKHLKIFPSSKYKSLGVFTEKDIPKGGFICEYAGELLTPREARRRTIDNERLHKMNYILCLKEAAQARPEKTISTIVDPSRKGNIGRYLNHSCEPNCQIVSVRVDCPIPKVAIFGNRLIKASEELCFHYNEGQVSATSDSIKATGTSCLCAASMCSGYMPNAEFLQDID